MPRTANPAAAFTLIELVLVMTVLLVVSAITAPQLVNFFRGRTLDSEARRFLALTRYGQSRAVSEGIPMVLWLDAKAGAYGLERQQGFASTEDERAIEFELEDAIELEAGSTDGFRGGSVPANAAGMAGTAAGMAASRSVVTTSTRESTQPLAGNLPAIVFMPDGFTSLSSPASVTLTERESDSVTIALSRSRLNYEIKTNLVLQRR